MDCIVYIACPTLEVIGLVLIFALAMVLTVQLAGSYPYFCKRCNKKFNLNRLDETDIK